MTAITKFMFDVHFDPETPPEEFDEQTPTDETGKADAAPDGAVDGDEVEEEEEEEVLPGYSEEQLEEAKAESFEAGKLEGAREAATTIEKETLSTLQAISRHNTELFGLQEQANSVLLRDAIGIAATIVRKLFPEMNEKNSLGEVNRLIEHTLLRLIEEPRVVIRINPDLMEALGERVDGLKAGAGYEGRIILKEDSSLPYGDCRMEWGDGSAERNVATLWQSIDNIVSGNLGPDPERDAEQGVVEVSVPKAPESDSPDDDKAEDDGPGENLKTEENHKESAPSEVPDVESVEPVEDDGIVDAASQHEEVTEVEDHPADDGADDEAEPDNSESPPEEPLQDSGEDNLGE